MRLVKIAIIVFAVFYLIGAFVNFDLFWAATQSSDSRFLFLVIYGLGVSIVTYDFLFWEINNEMEFRLHYFLFHVKYLNMGNNK